MYKLYFSGRGNLHPFCNNNKEVGKGHQSSLFILLGTCRHKLLIQKILLISVPFPSPQDLFLIVFCYN